MRFGHHFFNWDHAWRTLPDGLDLKLLLTKETGWEGFEAKPKEFGAPAEVVKEKADALGLECAAVGGGGKAAIDYAQAAGCKIVRTGCSVEECAELVGYAAERGIILAVHNHPVKPERRTPDTIETREQMLRCLDARPGLYACPDTGNFLMAGSDPIQTLRDLGERCGLVHLKDITAEGIDDIDAMGRDDFSSAIWCDIGQGAQDTPGIMKTLEAIGFDGWVMVERNRRQEDYEASARNMRRYLKELGY